MEEEDNISENSIISSFQLIPRRYGGSGFVDVHLVIERHLASLIQEFDFIIPKSWGSDIVNR